MARFALASFLACALLIARVSTAPPSSGILSSALHSSSVASTPASSSTQTADTPDVTGGHTSDDPNDIVEVVDGRPQPIRGMLGASILGPDNVQIELQNLDLLAPPTTDHGSVPVSKWPFSFSHNRVQTGGWARQQTVHQLPIATQMAAVNMRLKAGAYRELHWHNTAEWAYVLKGSTLINAVNAEGQNYQATVNPGDLWYFPAGIPHSLQATGDNPDGSEFLLVFDDGKFSEDSTFSVTDWLAHVPKSVLAKNFDVNVEAFNHIPADELYIFPSAVLPQGSEVESPQGTIPEPFSFALSKVPATQLEGGSVKIVDSSTFKVSTKIAAAIVTVEPGAMRELHWHPTEDEWSFFIRGQARVTIFASSGNAATYDFFPGDVGYIPASQGHYVENTGNTTLEFLEVFNSQRFQDISLSQWLALTPPEEVKAHLGLSDETIAGLSKTKKTVVGGKKA